MDGAAPRGAKGDNSCLNSVWNSKRIVTIDLLGDEFLGLSQREAHHEREQSPHDYTDDTPLVASL